jgi:hypothetical protein
MNLHSKSVLSSPLTANSVQSRVRLRQSGYAFLMALFMLLIFSAATVTILTNLATEGRRIREQETIWRGEQYMRAIRLYYHKTGHYPQTIDDLTKGVPGVHFLRQAYKDPMNKKDGTWRFIYVNGSGQITGSVRYATLQQMVLLDQYAGLVPGGAPMGQTPGIGVSAASLSSMGGASGLQPSQNPLSTLIPGGASSGALGTQNPQSGAVNLQNLPMDPAVLAQLLQQNGQNIDPSQIAQFLQQNGQNIDPSQVAQFLQQNGQNIDPSQISQYLQNLQNGQNGQNPPDTQNPPDAQNLLNSQNPQIHQYQPPDPNAPVLNPTPTDNNQDALFPNTSASSSQGFGTPGVQINPLLLMKPTGPVDGPVVGGFLTGVASTVDAKSVKVYRGGKKYSRWEFIWNPLEDAISTGSGAQAGGVPGQPGAGGNIPGSSPNSFGGNNPNNPNPMQPQPQPQQPQQPPPQQ